MEIEYNKSKAVECYRNFVSSPADRDARKNFSKTFGKELMKPALKIHERLSQCGSACEYNKIYGKTKNGIELVAGCQGKNPVILKVRINDSYRKFFNHVVDSTCGELLLTEKWCGNFEAIKTIKVADINNHDYKKLKK